NTSSVLQPAPVTDLLNFTRSQTSGQMHYFVAPSSLVTFGRAKGNNCPHVTFDRHFHAPLNWRPCLADTLALIFISSIPNNAASAVYPLKASWRFSSIRCKSGFLSRPFFLVSSQFPRG